MSRFLTVFIIVNLSFIHLISQVNPYNDYKEIFEAVQKNKIFKDQKTFVDCTPLFPVDTIIKRYNTQKSGTDFNLKLFVSKNFNVNTNDTLAIFDHIEFLWNYLTKKPDTQNSLSSLIALPNSYVIPGGRFREIYYWDSYFTMLGLQEAGKTDIMVNMIDNFAFLIDKYGHIPNGNRTYYLSRSQPPFFSLMVGLLAESKSDSVYLKYKHQLEKEYQFWMNGKEKLSKKQPSYQRVVMMKNNSVLNRYWDNLNQPRPESYLEDLKTYEDANNDSFIFRNIRAAAESGWDFSSRWFRDNKDLKTIHTTEIIPVDLNCLLYQLEISLMKVFSMENDFLKSNDFKQKAENRKKAIIDYCWHNDSGYFYDYDFVAEKQLLKETLAGVFPLFFNLVESNKAIRVLNNLKENFLAEGGLVTTLNTSGQQWDYPNGWAPLQWIGYKACKNYGSDSLANEIAVRWTNLNIKVFFETGKMLEKYNVINTNVEGGGGEYELQDGFGWTNGVFLKLWNLERKN